MEAGERSLVPRSRRKTREEERKCGRGGAWKPGRGHWCPAAGGKPGKKRENVPGAGHEEQKEALIPRLPS